jgi:RNA polymerase sigma-70 factor (ECF subfamily)
VDDENAGDVALAAACAAGDARAIATFEGEYAAEVRRVFDRAGARQIDFDDFAQALRRKLFAPPAPRIADYAGTGPLRAWLRVVATRTLLDMTRPAHLAEEPVSRDKFVRVPAPDDHPDLAYLKRLYGAAVTAAIEDAARALTPEARNMLRQHYAQGLSIDDIGRLQRVHRATAARRLQKARELLLESVRGVLAERLQLSTEDLESVLRLVQSQLDVTLERVFG